jgi:UDPglucose--hexose-1-phosphate uridylyltransferase
MPEFRLDPVTGHWAILAPERALRPDEASGRTGPCVFCPGQEAETPPEVARLPGPAGWRARVVPNKYPAVDQASGGVHEVVIESARHVTSFAALTEDEVIDVLRLWQDRICALGEAGQAWVVIFKNEGAPAGASIEHVHSQVVGLRLPTPGAVLRAAMFRPSGCPICADTDPARAVADLDGYSARAPLAPRFPHEVRIAPAAHRLRFEQEGRDSMRSLARLLLDVLGRLRRILGGFPYNLALQTFSGPQHGDAHWYLEILPRTSRPGGFEWGTGTFINTASPEESARRLREAGA